MLSSYDLILVGSAVCELGLAALLAAGEAGRRAFALAIAGLGLSLPFVVPQTAPPARFVAALGVAWGLARVIDLVREEPSRGAGARLWHVFAMFDTRQVRRVDGGLDGMRLATGGAFALTAALALWIALGAHVLPRTAHLVVRWSFGALFVYAAAETIDRLVGVGYRLLGREVPRAFDVPIAAATLKELWGRRWNRVVGGWLRANLFSPLARRRRVAAGTALVFAASAALHAYVALAAAGATMALLMGAFFVVQGALVAVERWGEGALSPAAARAFCLVTLYATSPLFVEPVLRALTAAPR